MHTLTHRTLKSEWDEASSTELWTMNLLNLSQNTEDVCIHETAEYITEMNVILLPDCAEIFYIHLLFLYCNFFFYLILNWG